MLPSDYLPIGKLNTVVFCPRRYYLEHVLAEYSSNAHIAEGQVLHERAQREGENVWVWSDTHRLIGIVDKLSFEGGNWVITEYKKGWLGDHKSDQVQLAALALCLMEQRQENVTYGYLYYHQTRRKQRIDFDDALKGKVMKAIATMRLLAEGSAPPPVLAPPSKCKGCSVSEVCQPNLLRRRGG